MYGLLKFSQPSRVRSKFFTKLLHLSVLVVAGAGAGGAIAAAVELDDAGDLEEAIWPLKKRCLSRRPALTNPSRS
jgi:hypothetical protein